MELKSFASVLYLLENIVLEMKKLIFDKSLQTSRFPNLKISAFFLLGCGKKCQNIKLKKHKITGYNSGLASLLVFRCRNFFFSKKLYLSGRNSVRFAATQARQRDVGKPSLLSHDVLPTVGFDAFQIGAKNSFRNDDKAERSLGESGQKLQRVSPVPTKTAVLKS